MMKNKSMTTITKNCNSSDVQESLHLQQQETSFSPKQLTHMFVQYTSQICHLLGLPP
ncbi:hypothetical protein DPMN_048251 [Dreissena polymorpha]|uniref:Uncharacterized protein n=1 Tax=Dreissena polymorpha TaxID=45954 RepID=A0A9D4D984_DREPO|nr:hypothetical protein DPMN_048251 [Dreissena polymorpha]